MIVMDKHVFMIRNNLFTINSIDVTIFKGIYLFIHLFISSHHIYDSKENEKKRFMF